MCGICGVINLDMVEPVDHMIVQRMNNAMQHRGPDDQGIFVTRYAGLAMRRLSIIDLVGGHQPIFNEDDTVCVILNGEIYNYRNLRTILESKGHHFKTNSDTEVIVHSYEEWGNDCPTKLRGMFGFAVWDLKADKILIARDRIGKKPIYYYKDDECIIFASEIKAILQHSKVPRQLQLKSLEAYLMVGYVPAPNTMFADIHKLPPGNMITISRGHFEVSEYWDLSYRNESTLLGEESYREQLRYKLEEAVRIRLMSDVPLGAFLSGGVDSSTVVALMATNLSQSVNTYSVGFEEKEFSELAYARVVADHLRTNHHEIFVDTCSPELIENITWHLDEPISDPATVPTFLVSKLARETVTVVLTGEGGDEVFGGYDYYQFTTSSRRYAVVPENLKRRIMPTLAKGVNAITGRPRYHDRTIWFMSLPAGEQMIAWVAIYADEAISRLYPHAGHINGAKAAFADYYHRSDAEDVLHKLMYIDTKLWLPDDLLMKVDKMSMANSLEARCPFLDYELMEFAASMPTNMKVNNKSAKYILKEAAKSILPAEIINRQKRTFDVPINKWLTTSLRDLLLDVIEDGIIKDSHLFNKSYICDVLLLQLEAGDSAVARQMWSLLNLGLWARKYNIRVNR